MEGNSCGAGHIGEKRLRYSKEQAKEAAAAQPALNDNGLLTQNYRDQIQLGVEIVTNITEEKNG
ncbi:MAG TPA: hypothetical protein PKD34_01600 [Candidatus Doudnabacteria bacterium]|nr:hypothetical protein [Candidatus Doudnabacteria bacterium]